jgi:hypothetical protein
VSQNEEVLEVEGEEIATMFNQLCDDGRSSRHTSPYAALASLQSAGCMVKVQFLLAFVVTIIYIQITPC